MDVSGAEEALISLLSLIVSMNQSIGGNRTAKRCTQWSDVSGTLEGKHTHFHQRETKGDQYVSSGEKLSEISHLMGRALSLETQRLHPIDQDPITPVVVALTL